MSVLPELDEFEPDVIIDGDVPRFTQEKYGLYTPDGEFITGHATDDNADEYVAAWRQISAVKPDPRNWRRSETFTRADTYFVVLTEYLGLDMDQGLGALSGRPHLPLIWETKVFTTADEDLLRWRYQWRYHTRAAAFAGHDQVVQALRTTPGVQVANVDLAWVQDQLAP